jgi:hypothetical protein
VKSLCNKGCIAVLCEGEPGNNLNPLSFYLKIIKNIVMVLVQDIWDGGHVLLLVPCYRASRLDAWGEDSA